ncbi:MAG: hypothetical protein GX100_01600 [candidate division WS1 bacterium]|jgi:hypothetical protein|nr:hypothetical protein [candidate division WS1 bacterium]
MRSVLIALVLVTLAGGLLVAVAGCPSQPAEVPPPETEIVPVPPGASLTPEAAPATPEAGAAPAEASPPGEAAAQPAAETPPEAPASQPGT